jgi:hypothetical protein
MRIRFTSPHPKDFSDDVLRVSHDFVVLVLLMFVFCLQAAEMETHPRKTWHAGLRRRGAMLIAMAGPLLLPFCRLPPG